MQENGVPTFCSLVRIFQACGVSAVAEPLDM